MNSETRNSLKTPKGTADIAESENRLRNKIFSKIRKKFLQHNAEELQTPTFEMTDILTSKYGNEASKLIFNLEDRGGDKLSLRYDLTVPLSRYISMNRIEKLKRFQIGNVFRRDNPSIKQGRMREFTQCDFDIVGNSFDKKLAELETLIICYEQLIGLGIERFKIVVNSRKFLNCLIFYICNFSQEEEVSSENLSTFSLTINDNDENNKDNKDCRKEINFNEICSSIDKLDKVPFSSIKPELEKKGLIPSQITLLENTLNEFFTIKTFEEKLKSLSHILSLIENKKSKNKESNKFDKIDIEEIKEEISNFEFLFSNLKELGMLKHFEIDFSLARGLDYYTGIIYEAKLDYTYEEKNNLNIEGIGSIAAGGRYDNLIGELSGKKLNAVGVSLGIERILVLVKALKIPKLYGRGNKEKKKVFVVGIKVNAMERFKVKREIIKAGVICDTLLEEDVSLKKQMNFALMKDFDVIVFLGQEELSKSVVKIRNLEEKREEVIDRVDMIKFIKEI